MNLPLLYKLQALHMEMDVILKRLRELSEVGELKKLKEEYQRLTDEYAQYEEKLGKNKHRLKLVNTELESLDINKRNCEDIKFSRDTNTVKKLESIEKQIISIDEKKLESEKGLIELAREAEDINKYLLEIKKKMNFIKKKFVSLKESSEKAREELKAQQAELSVKIGSMIENVDTESFEMYNRLTKAHPDPVSLVENGKCCGCKMEVPSMDFQALKNGSQETRCQSCGRLLYYIR